MRSATKKKLGKDPAYREYIRSLACLICTKLGRQQQHRTEVAHVGERGLSQKCPDRETVPLCEWHHQHGPFAQHRMGKAFWTTWGVDRDAVIAALNAGFQAWEGAA